MRKNLSPGRPILLAAAFLVVSLSCGRHFSTITGVVKLMDEEDHRGTLVTLSTGTLYVDSTRTDETGRFVFERVLPGRYDLEIVRPGYLTQDRPDVQIPPGANYVLNPILLTVDRVADATSGILGRVILLGEGDVRETQVLLGDREESAPVRGDGLFSFSNVRPGEHSLFFSHPRHEARQVSVSTIAGATLEMNLVSLQPRRQPLDETGRIEGTVSLESDEPPAGVIVVLEGTSQITTTDASGRYALANIREGTYAIHFQKANYESWRRENFFLAGGESLELNVTLRPVRRVGSRIAVSDPRTGAVTGLVIDGAGNPLRGADLLLAPGNRIAQSDERGFFAFEEVPPDLYVVTARLEGYQSERRMGVWVMEGEETPLAPIVLQPDLALLINETSPSSVFGTVQLDGQQDHRGVSVAILGTGNQVVTGPDGRYEFDSVPPGFYTLYAGKTGYEPAEASIEVIPGGAVPVPPMVLLPIVVHPRVIFTSPRNGERGVIVEDFVQIEIQFDQRMNGTAVKQAFSIDPAVNHRLFFGNETEPSSGYDTGRDTRMQRQLRTTNPPPPVGFDRLVARLYRTGGNPVALNQRYTVTLSNRASNLEGIGLEQSHVISFTTGGPRLIASWPEQGANDVYLIEGDALMFDFNSPINIDTFRAALRIRPQPSANPLVFGRTIPAGNRMRVELILAEKTAYTVTIADGVRTMDGRRIENTPFVLRFRTTSIEEIGDPEDDFEDLFQGEWQRPSGSSRRTNR